MSEKEIEFFIECIKGKKYLEYGCGGSTEIARKYCKSVVSIETDKWWAEKKGATWADIGKVGSWGRPRKSPTIEQLKNYYNHAKGFDIILIDGRFRVGVAYHCDAGEVLIHDYHREKYKQVEHFMDKVKQVDSLALFKKKPQPIIDVFDAD